MKNLIKKSIAAFILLTVFAISALPNCTVTPPPCGNMQCPCLSNGLTSDAKNYKDQESDDLSSFIIKMFEKIGFLF